MPTARMDGFSARKGRCITTGLLRLPWKHYPLLEQSRLRDEGFWQTQRVMLGATRRVCTGTSITFLLEVVPGDRESHARRGCRQR